MELLTNVETIVKLLAGLIAIITTICTIIWYRTKKTKEIDNLQAKIIEFEKQTSSIAKQKEIVNELILNNPDINLLEYDNLKTLSSKLEQIVNASFHSISIPDPFDNPVNLKIFISTDIDAGKVLTLKFPIDKGIAGWVYKTMQPSLTDKAKTDSHHFAEIDSTAGTNTGEGSILTLPLVINNRCIGVVQLMNSKEGYFNDSDIIKSGDFLPKIATSLYYLLANKGSKNVYNNNNLTSTIMFTDISKFSVISSKIHLNNCISILEQYYNAICAIGFKYNGCLREYLGDGLFFQFTGEDKAVAAKNAINAATEMEKEYEMLLKSWLNFRHPFSAENKHNIGIATGTIFSGMVGHPKYRHEKLIGNTVNLASHLCDIVKENNSGILICNNTYEEVKSNNLTYKSITTIYGQAWKLL